MDPAIRTKLDQHLIMARAKLFRAVAGGSCEIMRDWVRAYSGLSMPSYNIFQPRTLQGLTDDTLADTAAFFSSYDTLYTVELIHDRFPDGPDYLDKLGYQPLPPQMAMFSEGLHLDHSPQVNSAVMVEHITTVPSLTALCTLLNQVFDYSLDDVKKFFPVLHLGQDLRHTIKHYLAFLNEQPVGGGTLICLDGVASVWNLCTIDEFRQCGVATTLIDHMLSDADEYGLQLKVLYSSPQAYGLFSRFNFEIYTQRQWFLPPGLEYQEDW
jgi:ribosomal protein S18 acetylase RimI-like enzyme